MLGIIGGTGLYALEGIEIVKEHAVATPFGTPSAAITQGTLGTQTVFFLPRHGKHHEFLPSEVNYRANIWALKSLGVTKIIGVSATGSLQHEIKPGDLAIPDQYFDHTKGKREYTFFGNGLAAHISTAEPTCPALTGDIVAAAKKLNIEIHTGKTYACVEGPRLGTKAESNFLRNNGCDLVGMTNVPEAFLAREAQMSYATICVATDYDCWLEDPTQHVSVEMVFAVYGRNIEKVKNILHTLLSSPLTDSPEMCRQALQGAVFTPESAQKTEHKEILDVLYR
jgi:5'-methylthioadenosine phosphorylase